MIKKWSLSVSWAGALLLGICTATLLIGCKSTSSARLTPTSSPIRSLWILTYPGSFGANAIDRQKNPSRQAAFAKEMEQRIPATFDKNGIPAAGYLQLVRPLNDLEALEHLWTTNPSLHERTSHVLALTATREIRMNDSSRLEFEAVLWEPKTKMLLWKGSPSAYPPGRTAARSIDMLVGDVLIAMQRDGLIQLAPPGPVNLESEEISRVWIPLL